MHGNAVLLRAAGQALYGPRWQSQLADDLGVVYRTVRRWMAGDQSIPAGVWAELDRLLRDRRDTIDDVLSRLATS